MKIAEFVVRLNSCPEGSDLVLRQYVDQVGGIDRIAPEGITILGFAATYRYARVVEMLLSKGASCDAPAALDGRTALQCCEPNSDVDQVFRKVFAARSQTVPMPKQWSRVPGFDYDLYAMVEQFNLDRIQQQEGMDDYSIACFHEEFDEMRSQYEEAQSEYALYLKNPSETSKLACMAALTQLRRNKAEESEFLEKAWDEYWNKTYKTFPLVGLSHFFHISFLYVLPDCERSQLHTETVRPMDGLIAGFRKTARIVIKIRAPEYTRLKQGKDIFELQKRFCYRDCPPERSSDFVEIPTVLEEIDEFKPWVARDKSKALGNKKCEFILGCQQNFGQLVLYMKSDLSRDQRKDIGLPVSYREIVAGLKTFVRKNYQNSIEGEMEIAQLCLLFVENRDKFKITIKKFLQDNPQFNVRECYDFVKLIETLCVLTHIVDAHKGRFPGMDKFVRGIFRAIYERRDTLEKAFADTDQTYVLGRKGGVFQTRQIFKELEKSAVNGADLSRILGSASGQIREDMGYMSPDSGDEMSGHV